VERRENALVAPAALFMGVTMLAIFGAVAYFVSRDDGDPWVPSLPDPDPDLADPESPGKIGDGEWNISIEGTKAVNVQAGQVYTADVVVPAVVADGAFSVNVVPVNLPHAVGEPQISNIPHVGAVVPVTFTPHASGSIELVWPEGAVAGEQILNFYRRLDFVVSDGGGAVA
jgi:hypothetical protein